MVAANLLQLIARAYRAVAAGRYSIGAAYTILFYDWLISLDKEVAFIYPASWNAFKIAYLFCRYYPLAIAPFIFWGFVGNHEKALCESYYHALYACVMPMMLSAQFILMLRAYAFSGRKRLILVLLSASFLGLVSYVVWVVSTELTLTALFLIEEHTGCFATSNQPTIGSFRIVRVGAYQIGLITVLSTIFDCLNMFIVIWHCVQQRSTLGPLGQSFLKQGVLVYVIMTCMNALTIATYFTKHLLFQAQGSWFAYILPSALACRLVLLFRRKAAPTETELNIQHSDMIDRALEMDAAQGHTADTMMDSSIPSMQANPQAEP